MTFIKNSGHVLECEVGIEHYTLPIHNATDDMNNKCLCFQCSHEFGKSFFSEAFPAMYIFINDHLFIILINEIRFYVKKFTKLKKFTQINDGLLQESRS